MRKFRFDFQRICFPSLFSLFMGQHGFAIVDGLCRKQILVACQHSWAAAPARNASGSPAVRSVVRQVFTGRRVAFSSPCSCVLLSPFSLLTIPRIACTMLSCHVLPESFLPSRCFLLLFIRRFSPSCYQQGKKWKKNVPQQISLSAVSIVPLHN